MTFCNPCLYLSWSVPGFSSTFIFQHVQAGVPVGRIDQSVPRYIEIGCFGGERDVGPRIDQFGWRRRQPERQLLRRKLVFDVEDADAAGVVCCKNSFLALEGARPVLMQIVRTEGAAGSAIAAITRYRPGWDGHR